jgi:hypothetical protein
MTSSADNENIQLLRLRSFTLGRPVSDAEMLAADAQDRIVALVEVMEPFVSRRPNPIPCHHTPNPSLSALLFPSRKPYPLVRLSVQRDPSD